MNGRNQLENKFSLSRDWCVGHCVNYKVQLTLLTIQKEN